MWTTIVDLYQSDLLFVNIVAESSLLSFWFEVALITVRKQSEASSGVSGC